MLEQQDKISGGGYVRRFPWLSNDGNTIGTPLNSDMCSVLEPASNPDRLSLVTGHLCKALI